MVDLIIKYVGKGTTMTFDKVEDPSLSFPDISVCPSPGFKENHMKKISDMENPWLATEGLEKEEKVSVAVIIFGKDRRDPTPKLTQANNFMCTRIVSINEYQKHFKLL